MSCGIAIFSLSVGLNSLLHRGQTIPVARSFVLLVTGVAAFGQMNTGEISGSVQDATRGALPGAAITAQHLDSGQKFTAKANGVGEYLLPRLPLGVYSLTASATNFAPSSMPQVEIHVAGRLRENFVLEVGPFSGVVTVNVEAGDVQLESADIRDVIGRQQVSGQLPLKGRQFLDLVMLTPGVVRPPGGTRGDAMQQAGALVNVLGQRAAGTIWYPFDGVAITDEHFNNMVIAPSISAIEEVSIEKTSYAPEVGGKSGAVINVVSEVRLE